MENLHFILGFFVPIILAGGIGFLFGLYFGRAPHRAVSNTTTLEEADAHFVNSHFANTIEANTHFEDAVVVAVIPEYHHVKVVCNDNRQYSIGKRAKGIDWTTLTEGDKVQIYVKGGIVVEAYLK